MDARASGVPNGGVVAKESVFGEMIFVSSRELQNAYEKRPTGSEMDYVQSQP